MKNPLMLCPKEDEVIAPCGASGPGISKNQSYGNVYLLPFMVTQHHHR